MSDTTDPAWEAARTLCEGMCLNADYAQDEMAQVIRTAYAPTLARLAMLEEHNALLRHQIAEEERISHELLKLFAKCQAELERLEKTK